MANREKASNQRSGEVLYFRKHITITDAQFKQLPVTYIPLIEPTFLDPDKELVPDELFIPVRAHGIIDLTGGAYTNIDVTTKGILSLVWGAAWDYTVCSAMNTCLPATSGDTDYVIKRFQLDALATRPNFFTFSPFIEDGWIYTNGFIADNGLY